MYSMTTSHRRFLAGLSLVFALAAPRVAAAQEQPRNYLAINPLSILFTLYNGEFEHVFASREFSIGASTSYWGENQDSCDFGCSDEVDYFSVDGKVRYYPSGRALKGFSFGATVGVSRLSGSFTDSQTGQSESKATAFSFGFVLDYNWVLGRTQHFLVGTGIGAKRLVGLDIDTDGVTVAYPTARLSVGYAF